MRAFLLDGGRAISGGGLALGQLGELRRQVFHRDVMGYISAILRNNYLPTRRDTTQLPTDISLVRSFALNGSAVDGNPGLNPQAWAPAMVAL